MADIKITTSANANTGKGIVYFPDGTIYIGNSGSNRISVTVENTAAESFYRLGVWVVIRGQDIGQAEDYVLKTLLSDPQDATKPRVYMLSPGLTYSSLNQTLEIDVVSLFEQTGVRSVPICVRVAAIGDDSGNTYTEYAHIDSAYILNRLYNPAITGFSIVRGTDGAESDEGVNLLTTLKLSCASDTLTEQMQLTLHYAENAAADKNSPSIDLSAYIPQMIAGVDLDPDIITQTFSNGSDWGFYLTFGDEFESVSAGAQIFKAFANVHLSGKKTGGVCFGGFCTSQEGEPKFECHYPAYFYGGIALGGNQDYSEEEQDTGMKWIDGKKIYRRTFTGTIKASTDTTVLSAFDYETIIRLEGMHYIPSTGVSRSMNYYNSTSNHSHLYIGGSGVKAYSTLAGNVRGVVEYTKPDDAA